MTFDFLDYYISRNYIYANRHFNDHFGQYRGNIQFPLTVDKGTGENRDTRFFETEEEFLLFINTDDSLNSWNTGESEILVLATIINQPITVVHFQQQGFALGTPLEQRCDVKVYQPIPFLERIVLTNNQVVHGYSTRIWSIFHFLFLMILLNQKLKLNWM